MLEHRFKLVRFRVNVRASVRVRVRFSVRVRVWFEKDLNLNLL